MKVKVINKNLNDLQDKVFRPVGSIFETDDERGNFLLKNNAVEIVLEKEVVDEKVFNKQKLNEIKKSRKK